MPLKPVSGEIKAQPLNDNFSYLDSQFADISVGPFNTYNNLAELTSAYPKGRTGFAVVLESDGATGYIYIWVNNTWKKGALYQSQGIADNSVTTSKRTALGETGYVLSTSTRPICDLDNLTLKYSMGDSRSFVFYRGTSYEIPDDTTINFSSGSSSLWYIMFNHQTKLITAVPKDGWKAQHEICLGVIKAKSGDTTSFRTAQLFGDYTYINDKSRQNGDVSVLYRKPINIDFIARTVTIYAQTFVFFKGNAYATPSLITLAFPENVGTTFLIKYNNPSRNFSVENYQSVGNTETAIIAAVSESNKTVYSVGEYLINGIDVRNTNIELVKPARIDTKKRQVIIPNQTIFMGRAKIEIQEQSLTWTDAIAPGAIIGIFYDIATGVCSLVNAVDQTNSQTKVCILSFELGREQFAVGNCVADEYYPWDLSLIGNSLEDCISSWWVYPLAKHYQGVYSKTYLGYTDSVGFSGVISIDDGGNVVKKRLKKRDIDDHNPVAVDIMPDGRIITAYSTGHNIDQLMRVRISKRKENIEDFEEEILIKAPYYTCYAQLFYLNGKWFLFFRVKNQYWYYSTSEDGRNWTDSVGLIDGDNQYYVKFQKMSDSTNLRMVMYSNPNTGDTNIREGVFNTSTLKCEKADGTALGDGIVNKSNFPIIIAREEDKNNRILDVAITAQMDTKIIFAKFETSANGEYCVYENGNQTVLSTTGLAFYTPSAYFNGAIFMDENTVILSEGLEGRDYIREFKSVDGMWSKTRDLYDDKLAIRPVKIEGADKVVVQVGEYNIVNFTNFQTSYKLLEM